MASYFHNGGKKFFFKFCQLGAYSASVDFIFYIKTWIFFILYPIIYQIIKTEF